MKRFYLTFTLPILLLAVSCSDSDTPGGEPSPSDPREECRFSNVKATPAATSADFSASYLYLGGFLVKENGFVCTPAGGGAPVTVVCERSTEPACTLRDLAPETDYELYCYVVAGGHTFRSETISFTTLEKGEEPLPAAVRELGEETGLEAGRMIDLGAFCTSLGFSTEVLHIYLALDLRQGDAHPDEDEFINFERVPFDALLDRCLSGELRDGKTVAGVLKVYALRTRKKEEK